MTATATPSRTGAGGTRIRRFGRFAPVYRAFLTSSAWYMFFWAALIVVYAGIAGGIWLWGSADVSVWETSMSSSRGTMIAVGILMGTALMPTTVAHGVTRRTFATAALGGMATLSAVSAALVAGGFLVEHALFSAHGVPEKLTGSHLFTDGTQAHLVFAEVFSVQLAYALSGWLVGLSFYRFGPWLGILLIIPAAVPAVSCEVIATGGTWFNGNVPFLPHPDLPAAGLLLCVLAVVAAMFAVIFALTAGAGIRPKKN